GSLRRPAPRAGRHDHSFPVVRGAEDRHGCSADAGGRVTSPKPSLSVGGSPAFRLSPQQARLWSVLDHAPTAPPAGCVLGLDGQPERGRLRRALASLVERHEILRTVYRRLPGTGVGVQAPLSSRALRLDEAPAPGGDVEARLSVLIDGLRGARSSLSEDSGSLG